MKYFVSCLLIQYFWFFNIIANVQEISWVRIDEGLYITEFIANKQSTVGTSKITIIKIHPNNYTFNLINAKEKDKKARTAKEWCKEESLIAAVNAGMFLQDGLTNVGYMQNYGFVNSGKLNKYNTILAFNRKDNTVPEVQIIDLKCQDWNLLKSKYNCYSQGIRMIDCYQKNRWSQQDKRWSMVVIGIDKEGNILFIFTRSPYTVHDFINIILDLPISIYNAMYLEGGPEASLYLSHKEFEIEKFGSYETGFFESDNNNEAWPIPNVIGIIKKK